jgi:hypothetical protein
VASKEVVVLAFSWGLDALELIAAELERLRVLKEHELGVRLEHPPEGDRPYVVKVEE